MPPDTHYWCVQAQAGDEDVNQKEKKKKALVDSRRVPCRQGLRRQSPAHTGTDVKRNLMHGQGKRVRAPERTYEHARAQGTNQTRRMGSG